MPTIACGLPFVAVLKPPSSAMTICLLPQSLLLLRIFPLMSLSIQYRVFLAPVLVYKRPSAFLLS